MKTNILKKVTAVALSLAMVGTMAAGLGGMNVKAKEKAAAKTLTVKVEKHHKEYKNEDGEIYKSAEYQFPVFTGTSKTAAKLNTFFQKKMQTWVMNSEKNLENAKADLAQSKKDGYGTDIYYSDTLNCQITSNNGKYISILQYGSEYTMGAHGNPYSYSYIFDAKTGNQIKPAAVLKLTQKNLNNKVRTAFLSKYDKLQGTGECPFYEGRDALKKTLANTNFNNFVFGGHGYYLKNNRVYFYYNPYMVGPYAAQYIEVSLKIN